MYQALTMKTWLIVFILTTLSTASAVENPAEIRGKIGVDQKIGDLIQKELTFIDELGKEITLSSLFSSSKIPVILTPVYYRCAGLCNLTLNSVSEAILSLSLNLGSDYRLISVSFNPDETADIAGGKKISYLKQIGVEAPSKDDKSWRFLTGDKVSIDSLMSDIGFRYERDGADFIHSAALVILTPEGKISRYFADLVYDSKELKRALVDASSGQVGSFLDKAFHFCFRFDPKDGKYTLAVLEASKILGIATVLLLVSTIVVLKIKEKR